MNFIFVPNNAKPFIFPCILLYLDSSRRAETILVVPKGMYEIFSSFGVRCVVEGEWLKLVPKGGDVSFSCLHHTADGYYKKFKTIVDSLLDQVSSVTVSFFPDGFGDAMWGGNYFTRYLEESKSQFTDRLQFGAAFSFGIKHYSTIKKFGESSIIVLDFSLLVKFYLDNDWLNETVLRSFKESFGKVKRVVLVPHRPWCTPQFHGGIYDFSDTDGLLKIYRNIFSEINISTDLNILYRGDERYQDQSDAVYSELSSIGKSFNITPEVCPSWLTLEPIIFSLVSSDWLEELHFITLDSATFQPIAFMLDKFSYSAKVSASIGCPEKYLHEFEKGGAFLSQKLKPKINDFYGRYQSMKDRGMVDKVERIDSSSFLVQL